MSSGAAKQNEFEQSARLMEALQQAPISEMLLRRWGRTLAKYGITLEEMPEGKKELDQYLEMWGEARTPLVEKETGHTPSEP